MEIEEFVEEEIKPVMVEHHTFESDSEYGPYDVVKHRDGQEG